MEKLFDNCVLLRLQVGAMGIDKKADINEMQTEADKKRMKAVKKILDCEEYRKVRRWQGVVKDYIKMRSMPSMFSHGFYLVKNDEEVIKDIEKVISESLPVLGEYIDELVEIYPQRIEESNKALGPQFNQKDYPPVDQLKKAFYIKGTWLSLGVPDDLPEEIRQQATERFQATINETIGNMNELLIAGFKELVDHAVEKLSSTKANAFKQNVFVAKWKEFFDSFNAKNIMNNEDLSQLVARARSLLANVNADDLKNYDSVRSAIASQFKAIKTEVDKAAMAAKSERTFNFEEE